MSIHTGKTASSQSGNQSTQHKHYTYCIHTVIGLAIMAIFWLMPPIEPITPIGMRCVGIFLCMVYLWSAVDTLWPSIFGLFMLSFSGIDPNGVNSVWLNAIGNYTVLLTLFAMILFGAVHEIGDTMYIAKWFLTRKIFKGRPFVFLIVFYICCGVLSALVTPITSLIILWPVAIRLTETLHIERSDKLWTFFFVGMFLVSALTQPFFPFMGAQLIPLSAFQSMTEQMFGTAMQVPMTQYMAVNLIMTTLIMAVYLLAIRLLRIDTSKLKAVDPAIIEAQMQLPPMNKTQKIYLIMIPFYLLALLLPNFIKGVALFDFLFFIGPLGVTVAIVLLFLVLRIDGKPLLDFKEIAYRQMNWGIFFMIAAAVYSANTLSNAKTGVTDFLIQVLNPILGTQSELGFVAIMFFVALVITNFANNAAMAVVLMPVVLSFSTQLEINPIPVAMGVTLMVFVAMLTPAASPHAGMMHGRRDLYSIGEILKIGVPMCLITWAFYVFIGYPLMKLLLGV